MHVPAGFLVGEQEEKVWNKCVYYKPPPSHSVGCRTKIPELVLTQGDRSGTLGCQVPACAQKLYRCLSRASLPSLGWAALYARPGDLAAALQVKQPPDPEVEERHGCSSALPSPLPARLSSALTS